MNTIVESRGNAPSIVLIGGSGRSGTNITKAILAKHSRVYALPFEHRITLDPDGLVDFYQSFTASWSPYLADHKIKRLKQFLSNLGKPNPWDAAVGKAVRIFDPHGSYMTPQSYMDWDLTEFFPNYLSHVDHLISGLVDFRYPASWVGSESFARRRPMLYSQPRGKDEVADLIGQFINAIVADCLNSQGKDIFVEDNTWNILFASDLIRFTPQAKLLHVFRDPRDVVASLIRQRWAPKVAAEAATLYRDVMSVWQKNKADLDPGSFLELSLEELALETNKTMNKICDFIGLDLEPNMIQFDPERAHLGRWRQDLSSDEVTAIQPILAEWIKDLGYKL